MGLLRVWPLLDPQDLARTAPAWLSAALPIIEAQHGRSAAVARAYYRQLRFTETGSSSIVLPTVAFSAVAARKSLLVTGPVRIKAATARGVDVAQSADVAAASSAQAGARHSLSGGRDLLMSAIAADPKARGYQRVTSGAACDFCESLAGEPTSSTTFEAHDHCGCTAEPAFAA